MTTYLCRKDGTDLTEEVERAVKDPGPGVMNVDVVAEGSHPSGEAEETYLATAARADDDDLIPVVVDCFKCGTENLFLFRRKAD